MPLRSQDRRCALPRRGAVAAPLAAALSLSVGVAQELTPDPRAWRPLAYADLRQPTAETRTYADLWRDAIEENNRAYLARGDTRFRAANAPAIEAHFVIWSARKSVVLSILDTATGCTLKEQHAAARASVKLCPLRVAIYEGVQVRTMDGGQACFVERAAPSTGEAIDPTRAAAYASYDTAAKVVKVGLVIDHRAVGDCARDIPLHPR